MFSSSTGCEDTSYNNTNKTKSLSLHRVSSSSVSSKSSSTSSSPSPFSPSNNNLHHHHHHDAQQQKAKTMEEVWKDISLASLHDQYPSTDQDLSMTPTLHAISHRHHHNNNPNFILQDFLARPFNKDPSPRMVSTQRDTTLFGSPVPPPATVLSLNSGPAGFDFLHNSDPLVRPGCSRLQSNNPISNVSSFSSPFEPLDSSSGLPSFGNRRAQESDSSSGDRKHKRMIKNRESAARSRARKQAYTNELELEVKHLLEENAKLKRQQEKLYLAAAAQQSKKHSLHRTSTAPF